MRRLLFPPLFEGMVREGSPGGRVYRPGPGAFFLFGICWGPGEFSTGGVCLLQVSFKLQETYRI